jgi:hypothetical protein
MKPRSLAAAAAGSLVLAGCATMGGGVPPSGPQRPAVAVEDQVGTVDRAMLVGAWSCREMNPYPGRPSVTSEVRFDADGTGHNSAVVDTSQGGNPLGGRMALDYTYNWQVQGDRIVASGVQSSVKALDGNPATGLMAGLSQFVINRFSSELKPGTLDPLKLDRHELIVRNADAPGGPVLDCTRD